VEEGRREGAKDGGRYRWGYEVPLHLKLSEVPDRIIGVGKSM
jgi:hypothetical protein